jgi:ferredoxin-type protein NapF
MEFVVERTNLLTPGVIEMHGSVNRADFLRGMWRRKVLPQRPPWALPEEAFTKTCTGCGDCVAACPEKILVAGSGGAPVVDFGRSGCSFCGRCVDVCRAGAFRARASAPWSLRAAIGAECLSTKAVSCRVCGEHCEDAAIRFHPALGGRAIPVVAEACTGCGDCLGVCPVGAIAMREPEQ